MIFEVETIKNKLILNDFINKIDNYANNYFDLIYKYFYIENIILKISHNGILNRVMNETFYNITEYINKLKPFKWSIKKPMDILYFLTAYRYPEKDLNIIR